MTEISQMGRIIANNVSRSAEAFDGGLAQSIANRGNDSWGSGPLWDAAILSMRTDAGSLEQNLILLKEHGSDVFAQLSPGVQQQYDQQLSQVRAVLDEIHTDRGGVFATKLTSFRDFGDQVAQELRDILAKADEAPAAVQAVNGVEESGWTLVGDAPAADRVRVIERAADAVQARAAGER